MSRTCWHNVSHDDYQDVQGTEGKVMSHYIKKCKECGAVIEQCRCFALDKTVTYGLCEDCKAKMPKEAVQNVIR
jgi:predicted nucleic acid-binding Zn ribbon protein